MEIIQTQVMRGPNYWSVYRQKLIVTKIQLEDKERDLPAEELAALAQRLETLNPPIHNLRSYRRVLDIVAQVAVEIQSLAGMDCIHAIVEPSAQADVFLVIFSYTVERAGTYAAEASVNLVNAILANAPYNLARDVHRLRKIHKRYSLSPGVQQLVDEAIKRDIPVRRLDHDTLLFGYGDKQHIFRRGDSQFPKDSLPGRIPIVALTGTNGQTATSRLIAHFAKSAGFKVGLTNADGIYIQDELISIGDCTGPISAGIVLKDPEVNFAVLECASAGILNSGLGFDRCNVSIVTNISHDQISTDGLERFDELAHLLAVVPKSTAPQGYAILNADDESVYAIKDDLYCHVALFSLDAGNPGIAEHVAKGFPVAIVDRGYFMVIEKGVPIKVARVEDLHLTVKGKPALMTENILAALLTAFIFKIPLEVIQDALYEFIPLYEYTRERRSLLDDSV